MISVSVMRFLQYKKRKTSEKHLYFVICAFERAYVSNDGDNLPRIAGEVFDIIYAKLEQKVEMYILLNHLKRKVQEITSLTFI